VETLYWESIMNDKNPAAFEAYLKKYPGGEFADLAKIRIADLKKESVKPAIPPFSESASITPPSQPASSQKPPDQSTSEPDMVVAQSKSESLEKTPSQSSQRFTVNSIGIIKDNQTGKEWMVGPDKDMTWDEADVWAKKLETDGKNWRLPKKSEVATLYQKGAGNRNLDPVFQTTGWYVWTESEDSKNAWSFYLYDGEPVNYLKGAGSQRRAFAIQSPGEAQMVSSGKPSWVVETSKYSKLGNNGEELPFSAKSWLMVRDNETGLIWEVKKNRDGKQNYDDPNDADNDYNFVETSQLFIETLNSKFYGGFSDWRIPTRHELKTLVDSNINYIVINNAYFPNMQNASYWSSTSAISNNFFWVFYFNYGVDGIQSKINNFYVIAVRGGI
jgi:hypothetical protein